MQAKPSLKAFREDCVADMACLYRGLQFLLMTFLWVCCCGWREGWSVGGRSRGRGILEALEPEIIRMTTQFRGAGHRRD